MSGRLEPTSRAEQLSREILDLDHAGNEHQVNDRPDEEKPAGQEPQQPGDPPAEVEPVQSQHAEAPHKPEQVRYKRVFHSNTLGHGPLGFQSK